MKKILGLDLGTNSIGWALIEKDSENHQGRIINLGSRIIPMSEDILGKFDSGITESDTAQRTGFRGVRRLRERHLLRRERLHRVLNILNFLPKHYAREIDFERRLGQFNNEAEPKIAYCFDEETKSYEFVFKRSFNEMLEDFKVHQPQLLQNGKKIPYDWTIYYLRKKALKQKIEKEELAWLLLNFNQKRGYYQLRGEDDDEQTNDKVIEILTLKVTNCIKEEKYKNTNQFWYKIVLEGGYEYKRTSENSFEHWINTSKDFIITKELNEDGTIKYTKDNKESRPKIKIELLPTFEEIEAITDAKKKGKLYKKIKIRTEDTINKSGKTVGSYIYDTLLQNPKQKINGKLVRVIERNFYKKELEQILGTQKVYHPELQDIELLKACKEELYENNEAQRSGLENKDLGNLFINDIIFYQRPLKSKKSLISDCKFEKRPLKDKDGKLMKDDNGKQKTKPIKCIAKSHPLFQEFRLWQWVKNLRIYEKATDLEVTNTFLNSEEDWVNLFDWLNDRKEIEQEPLIKFLLEPQKLKPKVLSVEAKKYRWNYVYDVVKDESKKYPCNETRAQILTRLSKVSNLPANFLTKEVEESLWHLLYSVTDRLEIPKALQSFAAKNNLFGDTGNDFVEQFKKFPPYKSDYGSYSAKAIKKLLPLMRMGKYWNDADIHPQTKERIDKIINGEFDEKIRDRVRDKAINLKTIQDFKGLPIWLTSYIVYDRHSEDGEMKKWALAKDIENYLNPKIEGSFKQHSLRNPIVEQVITETLRVVKDIWNTYGNGAENFFNEIHVELGRSMKNTKADRENLTKKITENENTNLRIKALLAELVNPEYQVDDVKPFSPYQHELLKLYEEGISIQGEIPDYIQDIQKKFRESVTTKQPSKSDFYRYKLWLDQGYISPYTGEMIPLNRLFTTDYQIEHIIPKSRFFDDSFTNKVICEAVVNGEHYKKNQTAFEFIKNFKGTIVTELSSPTHQVKIFTEEQYIRHVEKYFSKSRSKMKKLLLEDIPEKMIERQMNDTRYISKVVKNLLSNIVREESEQETTSKNVLSSNGQITDTLKQDWGLKDVWNSIIAPRFERLNKLTSSNNFGNINEKTQKFLPTVPLELAKGFSKKRIDHRHHAMDALVIACATRNHINYLNNQHALDKSKKKTKEEKQKSREDLRYTLCFKKYIEGSETNYKWVFKKPWETFTKEAKDKLQCTVVSFKQNIRVINKTVNKYEKWERQNGVLEKVIKTQEKGDSWAIRKPMHKDTISGLVRIRFKKTVQLSSALDSWEDIVDNDLRKFIKGLIETNNNKASILKFFKSINNLWYDKDVSKVEIYYWDNDKYGIPKHVASRVKLDESFNKEKILTVTDTGIQAILLSHLSQEKYQNVKDEKGKPVAPEFVAFSADGIEQMNRNIIQLNKGKFHQPIYKVRIFEARGTKFSIGQTGNKKDKFVVPADGTNLFFAIYQNEKGERSYQTIPLNIVIENQKQGGLENKRPQDCSVPLINEKGDKLLFFLSPNDLVYVPNTEEKENLKLVTAENINPSQIYRLTDCSEVTAKFVPCVSATTIFNMTKKEQSKRGINYPIQNEYGLGSPESKNPKALEELERVTIKEVCWKLEVNRLGQIIKIIK